MGSLAAFNNEEEKRKLLCLTVFTYKKPGISDEDYHRYVTQHHVPLGSDIMAVVQRFVAHNDKIPPESARIIADPFPIEQFEDFDIIATCVISDVARFEVLKRQPHWTEKVIPDWANFADVKRTRVCVGWFEQRIRDGVVIN